MTDILAGISHSNIRWIDAITGESTQEQKNEEAAQQAIQALRESFYGKEE